MRCMLYAVRCLLRVVCICQMLHVACGPLYPGCFMYPLHANTRCPLHVACRTLTVARCLLHVVCCMVSAARCLLYVVGCTLSAARCLLHVVCRTLSAARCLPHVVCCTLSAARSPLHVVCSVQSHSVYHTLHAGPSCLHARRESHMLAACGRQRRAKRLDGVDERGIPRKHVLLAALQRCITKLVHCCSVALRSCCTFAALRCGIVSPLHRCAPRWCGGSRCRNSCTACTSNSPPLRRQEVGATDE
jgi:hypothetical protein